MAKITKVIIVDKNTIRLGQDASIGDEIDLTSLETVDTSSILNRIAHNNDVVYKQKVQEMELSLNQIWELKLKDAINNERKKLEDENNKLVKQTEITDIQHRLEKNEIKEKYEHQVTELNNQIAKYLNEIEHQKEMEMATFQLNKTQIEAEYRDQINNLKLELAKLTDAQNRVKKEAEDNLKMALLQKDKEISELRLQKSRLNVKELGEELETWCNNEYNEHALMGFSNCTWIKDNQVIKNDGEEKGTKADYLFKVYANEKHELELTSVIYEMKNEAFDSKNKKKNSDHYAKLDLDRQKKNYEYALLISELEMNSDNDVPIRKVPNFEKMYVVRPQYFIAFLGIITALANKYREITIDVAKQRELFKETDDILVEFEDFKNELIDKPLTKLETATQKIIAQVGTIKKSASIIEETAEDLVNKTFTDMRKKIENFKITKMIKKINQVN